MLQQENKTISQKLKEYEALISWFDSDDFTLEEALQKYAEAEKVATDIQDHLKEIKNEITVLKQSFDA